MERPLIADIVDLVAALLRAPPFSGSLAIYWDVVSGSGRASAPISLEPSCRHGASGWHRLKLCELPQILGGGRKQELVSRAARPPQSEATESEDALEMGEQHLHLLPDANAHKPAYLPGFGRTSRASSSRSRGTLRWHPKSSYGC